MSDKERETPLVTEEDFRADIEAARARLLRFESIPMLTQLVAAAFADVHHHNVYHFPEVEYAALVFWHEAADAPNAVIPTQHDVAETLKDLVRLFGRAALLQHAMDVGRAAPDPIAEIIRTVRSSGLRIRVPAYPVHEQAVLDGLFGPYESNLDAAFGFTAREAAACFSAFYEVYNAGITHYRSEAAVAQHGLGARRSADCVLFDTEKVAHATGIERARVAAVLEAFSVMRGEPDRHALRPSPLSMLRTRPLLAVGDGRYLAPNMDLLLYAVQPRLESLMKRHDRALFDRYEPHRSAWLESEALGILESALPGGSGTTGAHYRHEGILTESDVVYKVDDVVYLVECKAGVFADSAMRGSPDQLPRDIVDIITTGHDQATRAEQYVAGGGRAFYDRSGRVTLYTLSGKIREIIRLVATLAPAASLATSTKALHEASFLPGIPSWIITLPDLMVVSECMTVPGEFRNYSRARSASLDDDALPGLTGL